MPRYDALPPTLPPRDVCREAAAGYIGISPTTFDKMVSDGRMPKSKMIGGRKVWDVRQVDQAFTALPGDGDANVWDGAT